MVKFYSQWSTLASCPPFFEWLVGEAILGLSLGPPACLPLGPCTHSAPISREKNPLP